MPRAWLETGAVRAAHSIEDLAREIGVDSAELRRTTDRFNESARLSVDSDFHRGENAYENYYGDPTLPNPNLAELKKARTTPFESSPATSEPMVAFSLTNTAE